MGWFITGCLVTLALGIALTVFLVWRWRKSLQSQPLTKEEVEEQIASTAEEIAKMSAEQLADYANELLKKRGKE